MSALLKVRNISRHYGMRVGCEDVSFDLHPGELLCIVGESGSGKSTLLNTVAAQLVPTAGSVSYRQRDGEWLNVNTLNEADRRRLAREEWGFVTQNPRDGLRLNVSAGANVAERLMALGMRNYTQLRGIARSWLERVEIDPERIDDAPTGFSGGMQQRLQIARTLVTQPRLVFMDEPTAGLDVSVQARILDLLRRLVNELGLAAVMVTHDLAVARLLAARTIVMQGGRVVETGLTDQILDDPQHPYTQLLVSSVLTT
jgi:putative phosphonate transport system ATP-binding protein